MFFCVKVHSLKLPECYISAIHLLQGCISFSDGCLARLGILLGVASPAETFETRESKSYIRMFKALFRAGLSQSAGLFLISHISPETTVSGEHFCCCQYGSIFIRFYARQLYRQVLLRARISYGNSVCPSVRHDPVRIQGQVFTI